MNNPVALIGGFAVAFVTFCASAEADDRCGAIRTAQAIGIITEDPSAAARLTGSDFQAPLVGYELLAAKRGDTLESLATIAGAFAPGYGKALVSTLNPSISTRELDEGQIVRIPKVIPPSEKFWESERSYDRKTWSDLAGDLKLEARFKQVAEETYETVKELSIDPSDNGQDTSILGSVDRMYKSSFASSRDVRDFRTIEAQLASLQGISYVRDLVNSYESQPKLKGLTDIALTAIAAAERTEAISSGRVQIVVLTKSAANKPLEGLRVYRATPLSAELGCMNETKIEFDTRSYEASGLLPIARWLVWAEDGKGRRSVPRPIDLVDQSDNGRKFDLTVKWSD